MRLIDADELKRDILELSDCENGFSDTYDKDRIISVIDDQPSVEGKRKPDLTHIIFETLAECGIYGEEATIKLIGTLKRLGRNDLLPPCARRGE